MSQPCEICGQPAPITIYDSTAAGDRREAHCYCREHDRIPAVLPPTKPAPLEYVI
jgi:hypothetical protein